jgi:acetyl esterase
MASASPHIDPRAFDQGEVTEETRLFNDVAFASLPAMPLEIHAIREMVARTIANARPNGEPYRSAAAELVAISENGPWLRVLRPSCEPRGIYVHAHGGGWSFGGAADHDAEFEALAVSAGVVVGSIEFRLAPEHPYPAPLDDCERALRFVLDGGLGAELPVVIGGESSGANLILAAALRIRNSAPRRISGAVLYYGAYDLSGTPSSRNYGVGIGMVNSVTLPYFYDLYTAGKVKYTDPDVSPLYADLAGLPPVLLIVGTADPLIDDSLFLHTRLLAAGVQVKTFIGPGGLHGFNFFPLDVGRQAVQAHVDFIRHIVAR